MINTIADIAQKLIAPAKHLAMEGIPIHAYVTDLTWLLFLKIANLLGEVNHVPAHLNWNMLIHKRGKEQYEYYQKIIKELGQHREPYIAGLYAHASTAFKNSEQLTLVITTLAAVDVLPIDDLGEVYETLLEKCTFEDDNRLCIAPRSLVDLIVILIQPQLGELIQDPLAGTASFVIAADEYIQVMSDELLDSSSTQKNSPSNIIAVEPDLVRQRLALMNCLLHHIDHSQHLPVRWGDSLLSNLQAWPQADVIFSMLVFANTPTDELGNYDASLALLQHIYQTLKPGGRAAVVLPDKVLKAVGPAQQIRSTLLDTCVVQTILRLPYGIFYPHKVLAHLLFFKKGQTPDEKTETVWFYDLRTDKPIFGPYLHLTREYLKPFEMVYGDDPNGQSKRYDEGEEGRWRCFSRETLAKQNDKLDLCWLRDSNHGINDNLVTGNIWEVLNKTVGDLEDLTDILMVNGDNG